MRIFAPQLKVLPGISRSVRELQDSFSQGPYLRKSFIMPVGVHYLEVWRSVRTLANGAQGNSTLMERKSNGELAVRKRIRRYDLINGRPLEATILQNILPSNRRIIKLTSFSFEPVRHDSDVLIEWFEYCRGGDLLHALAPFRRISEDFIWHCFVQLAEALDVVHNAGSRKVVHRDVKPGNIFLDQKYRHEAPWPDLKLGDFGEAGFNPREAGFMALRWQGPELPLLSAAGDIWGLGAIVHWLAHGQPPIAPRPRSFGGSLREWEARPSARQPMPLPLSYSGALNRHMMRCLKRNPDERISSRELVRCLRRDRPRPRR